MKWVPFIILTYLVMLAQCTVGGRWFTFSVTGIGMVGPDLSALLAVFMALNVRSSSHAALAGWVLGLAVDLTAGGVTAVGPMPIAYAAAAAMVFQIREAFFYERPAPQVFLTLLFCLVAHGIWVTLQAVLAFGEVSWEGYGRMLLQAAALAVYTAVLMPLAYLGLRRIRKWLTPVPTGRRHRRSAAPTR
jgi:cell shape-determining protein MreD